MFLPRGPRTSMATLKEPKSCARLVTCSRCGNGLGEASKVTSQRPLAQLQNC
jgi:hypothetical protein